MFIYVGKLHQVSLLEDWVRGRAYPQAPLPRLHSPLHISQFYWKLFCLTIYDFKLYIP